MLHQFGDCFIDMLVGIENFNSESCESNEEIFSFWNILVMHEDLAVCLKIVVYVFVLFYVQSHKVLLQ